MTHDAILLDVGGVFLVPHEEPVSAALDAGGVRHDATRVEVAHYHGVCAIDLSEGPGEDRPTYLRAYAAALDVPTDEVDRAVEILDVVWTLPAFDLWRHRLRDSVDALPGIRNKHAKVGIVSNSDGSVEEQLRQQQICQVGEGVGVPVLAIIDSRVVGIEKPDPAIFAPALEKIDAAPADTLFVGDSLRYDVRGARAAGLHPVHLDPYGLCRLPHDHDHVRTLAELA